MERTAEYFAKHQREISLSEFFEKNRHLLGFDNPTKALLIVVKEAVDNSLDACEEARVLPRVKVVVKHVEKEVYRVSVEDNGPGILEKEVPKIFGKLLYGSKFHRLKQTRGQQGLGISCALLYAQLTTGEPAIVYTKTGVNQPTHVFHLKIDVSKNEPKILKKDVIKQGRNALKTHGTRVIMTLVGRYRKSKGIDEYLLQTAIANPFAEIVYQTPNNERIVYKRSVEYLPKEPKEINPHPHGVEFGLFLRMLGFTKSKTITSFLQNEFSSIGSKTAKLICKIAKIKQSFKPKKLMESDAKRLLRAMQEVKIQRPPTDCLSPIGKDELKKGLKQLFPEAEFIATTTRPPSVYRGNPFIIEAGIVYDKSREQEKQVEVMRLANRVPLLYQMGAGAINDAITKMNWRIYNIKHSHGSLPIGPYIIVVHMCSTWVPFISESKEAIAPYPEIVKEIKLALQECARSVKIHRSRQERARHEAIRLNIFKEYFPIIVQNALELSEKKEKINYQHILEKLVKKVKI